MGNYVKPNIIQKFSGLKVELWEYLEKEIGNREGSFELNQSKLAKKFDVSRKSIQNALKAFQSSNLIEKVESRTGRGIHPLYSLIWTFREQKQKSATPSRVECTTPRNILTKGHQWRYFAYKFRVTVENSSLARKSQTIVGKLLNYLKGKPPDLFQETLTYLKRWLSEGSRTLKGFFAEFYHQTLKGLARSQRELEKTEQFIRDQVEQREKVRNQYREDPPPRLKDCGYNFDKYRKELEKWEENHAKESSEVT